MAIKTSAYLYEKHDKWRKRNSVNLAEFFRNVIDGEIAKEGMTVMKYTIQKSLADKKGIPRVIKGVKKESTSKAILVDPLNRLSEKVWLPRSSIEDVEPVGPYEEEADFS